MNIQNPGRAVGVARVLEGLYQLNSSEVLLHTPKDQRKRRPQVRDIPHRLNSPDPRGNHIRKRLTEDQKRQNE